MTAPDGVEWRVSRRWVTRRPKLARPRPGELGAETLNNLGSALPDVGSLDLGGWLLVVAGLVVFVLVVVPIVFFGIELVILGALLSVGVIARTVLRQPWVIEAKAADPLTPGRQLEWRVRGWRKSGELIARVASDLSAGREPDDLPTQQ